MICLVVAVVQERCGIVWIGLVMLYVPCGTLYKFPRVEANFTSNDWFNAKKLNPFSL